MILEVFSNLSGYDYAGLVTVAGTETYSHFNKKEYFSL